MTPEFTVIFGVWVSVGCMLYLVHVGLANLINSRFDKIEKMIEDLPRNRN